MKDIVGERCLKYREGVDIFTQGRQGIEGGHVLCAIKVKLLLPQGKLLVRQGKVLEVSGGANNAHGQGYYACTNGLALA